LNNFANGIAVVLGLLVIVVVLMFTPVGNIICGPSTASAPGTLLVATASTVLTPDIGTSVKTGDRCNNNKGRLVVVPGKDPVCITVGASSNSAPVVTQDPGRPPAPTLTPFDPAPTLEPWPADTNGPAPLTDNQLAQQATAMAIAQQEAERAALDLALEELDKQRDVTVDNPPDLTAAEIQQQYGRPPCSYRGADPATCDKGVWKPTPVNQ
jgi:hypothetical protein